MAGLLRPLRGNICLDGTPLDDISLKVCAQKIAYLAQERQATWSGTVLEFVALGRTPYRGQLGRRSKHDEQALSAALVTAGCEGLKARHFHHLSGGEQARVYLARALAVQADILLADEPIAALDPAHQISTLTQLRDLTKRGTSVVASLHDLSLAQQFCSRIWVVHEGALYKDANAKAALNKETLRHVFGIKITNGHTVLSGKT
jgi:iron complex transport system ATP-binding protein